MKKLGTIFFALCFAVILFSSCSSEDSSSSSGSSHNNSSKTIASPYRISAQPLSSHSVKVTWEHSGYVYFNIYISETDDLSTAKFNSSTSSLGETSIEIDGLNEFTSYYFWVEAYYGSKKSQKTRGTGCKTKLKAPISSASKKTTTSINVQWLPQDKTMDAYEVIWGVSSDIDLCYNKQSFLYPKTSCVISNLKKGQTYYVFVRAQSGAYFGDYSYSRVELK